MQGKCRMLTMAIFLFVSYLAVGQSSSPTVLLPKGFVTWNTTFTAIKSQLHIEVSWKPGSLDTTKGFQSTGLVKISFLLSLLNKRGFDAQLYENNIHIERKSHPSTLRPKPSSSDSSRRLIFHLTVTDEKEIPLAKVNIEDINTGKTIQTGDDGKAVLPCDKLPLIIKMTHVGRESLTKVLRKEGHVLIEMAPMPDRLDETIVDYATDTRKTNPGNREEITGHQLTTIAAGTPQTLLEGQIAGLLATQTSGYPGNAINLVIRGQSSILNGSDPLYIIDRIPYAPGNQSTSNIVSGNSAKSLNPLSFIPASDIERIEVLKDADATAIYGSRGANGVVLITTKHWKAGRPKLDIQYSTGFNEVTRLLPVLNFTQYAAVRREALKNDGLPVDTVNAWDLLLLDTSHIVNWEKWMTGNKASLNNLQLSLMGGSSRYNYIAGVSLLRETNVFPSRPTHDRLNTYFNVNHRSASGRLEGQFSGVMGWDRNNQFISLDPTQFQLQAPNAPQPEDGRGNLTFLGNKTPYFNPYSLLRQTYQANSHNFLVDWWTSCRLFPWLTLKANIGGNEVLTREFGQTPIAAQDPSQSPTSSSYAATTRYRNTLLEPQVEIKKEFGKFRISWLGGASWQSQNNTMSTLSAFGFTSDAFLRDPAKADSIAAINQQVSYQYAAQFTRINGNWDDKYILDLTGRRDGSSRFGPQERFGNFGAAGLAWIFSNEKTLQHNLPSLSLGKLRASYGITGNDQIGDHHLQYWAPTAIQPFQILPGFYSPSHIDSGQTWETIRKMEVSLDLGLFDDHLLFNITWYRHRSKNQLMTNNMADSLVKFQSWPVVLENRGWEFNAVVKPIDKKEYGWSLSFNWSLPVSRLVSFPGLTTSPYATTLVVGKSLNVVKGLVYTGVDKQTGLFRFEDRDHDGRLTDSDRTIVGKLDVTGFGGLDNLVRWRQFQLDVLFDARIQTGTNYLSTIYANNPPGSTLIGLNSNVPKVFLHRWQQPGDNASYQKLTTNLATAAGTAILNYNASSAILSNAVKRMRGKHGSLLRVIIDVKETPGSRIPFWFPPPTVSAPS